MQKSNDKVVNTGLVISSFGNIVALETSKGDVIQCHLRRNQESPVVGDKVEWLKEESQTSVISAVLPRQSVLLRSDSHGNKKPIAANINTIVIVMAPPPIFSEYLIDRYIVAAELLRIPVILIVNKADLLDPVSSNALHHRLSVYQQMTYLSLLTSAITEDGLKELEKFLKNKRVVFVGPSGVGKSSIIAAFCQGQPIRIGSTTSKGVGKHTTAANHLYHLPFGGEVIDSPGVREFNVWPMNQRELLQGFKEFQLLVKQCKFRDCQHLAEPQCAVKQAVNEGKISAKRYESYQTMIKTLCQKV